METVNNPAFRIIQAIVETVVNPVFGFSISFHMSDSIHNFYSFRGASMSMDSISRFVIWICSKFNREQIERIVKELNEILRNRNPEVKPKDTIKEKYPNYRNFHVDSKPPLKDPPKKKLS